MKIVHIMTRHFGNRYGADANIAHWMEWEQRQGHEVVLVAGRDSPSTGMSVPVRLVDALVRDVSPVDDLRAVRQIRRILRDERPDLVHTHHSKAGILGRLAVPPPRRRASRRAGSSGEHPTMVVHTVHMASFGPGYGRLSHAYLAAERLCARRTHEFVTVGHELRERYLAAGIGEPDRFSVVRSPAGVERYLATRSWDDARRREVRTGWDLPVDGNVVVAAGLLEERKRPGLIIDRLSPLLSTGAATLVLAGEGPLRDELIARVEAAGLSQAVRLVGYVDSLPDLVAAADVFVHAARVEGVPQTVLQALAAGVPVVATAVEGLQEMPDEPVVVVDVDAEGLCPAVQAILDGQRRPAVPVDRILPWTVAAVEQQIGALHRRWESAVMHRRGVDVA